MIQGLPGGLVGKKNILFSNIEMLYGFNKKLSYTGYHRNNDYVLYLLACSYRNFKGSSKAP